MGLPIMRLGWLALETRNPTTGRGSSTSLSPWAGHHCRFGVRRGKGKAYRNVTGSQHVTFGFCPHHQEPSHTKGADGQRPTIQVFPRCGSPGRMPHRGCCGGWGTRRRSPSVWPLCQSHADSRRDRRLSSATIRHGSESTESGDDVQKGEPLSSQPGRGRPGGG